MESSPQQRKAQIMAEVFEKRHVTARDLAAALDVSEATVRRDLKALADDHQVDLVYGGATLRPTSDFSFRSKGQRHVEAKRAIGKIAAGLVHDGEHIFLDSGTTSFEMAPFLKRRRGLNIIVNSARLALELDSPGVQVILLGGLYRPDRMDTTGPLATSTLEQLRGYVAFIGADGLHREFGLAASDIESAQLYRLAVGNARETVLLADHSKFTSPSLYKIVDWDRISRVVTDSEPVAEWSEFFRQRNIEVLFEK